MDVTRNMCRDFYMQKINARESFSHNLKQDFHIRANDTARGEYLEDAWGHFDGSFQRSKRNFKFKSLIMGMNTL